MTGVPILDTWKPEVTHVIASTDNGGAYKRTLKVLKGIINGKWILKVDCKKPTRRLFKSFWLPLILTGSHWYLTAVFS